MSEQRAKLSALIRGLMDSVQDSTAVAGQHYLHAFRHYFSQQDGVATPDHIRIEVSPGHILDVPLIALLRLPSYQLEELEVEMSLRMVRGDIKRAVDREIDDTNEADRVSYTIEPCPKDSGGRRSDRVNLRLKFKAHEATEAYHRALDALLNGMQVASTGEEPEHNVLSIGKIKKAADNESAAQAE